MRIRSMPVAVGMCCAGIAGVAHADEDFAALGTAPALVLSAAELDGIVGTSLIVTSVRATTSGGFTTLASNMLKSPTTDFPISNSPTTFHRMAAVRRPAAAAAV